MTTDLYSTVLYQDGEQLTFDDLNNGQRFLRAQLTDQILQSLIGSVANASTRPDFGGDDGADASTLWAYCVSPGRAFLRQGSANNKIQVAPGTLLQKIANATGADSTFVPFTFVGTEEWTIASGDATNPRVDVLQMKLEYITDTLASVDFQDGATRANTTTPNTPTRRRIQCTLSMKAGTPAASPRIPDPDTGFVPVGTAVVGHGWTSAGAAPIFGVDTAEANNVVIHDQRMPIGVKSLIADPGLFLLGGTATRPSAGFVTPGSGSNNAWIRCPTRTGRLLAIDLNTAASLLSGGNLASAGALGRMQILLSGVPSSDFVAGNGFGSNITPGTQQIPRSRRIDFESLHTPNAGPTVLSSTTNSYGVPFWTSGYRCPQISTTGVPSGKDANLYLRLTNLGAASSVAEATFYIAG